MGKKKGDRRERGAVEIYEGAGYQCERAVQAHYGARSDFFGLFDIVALRPDAPLRFAQVKSNKAAGVNDWMDRVKRLVPDGVEADFLVCHDRAGWRLIRPTSAGWEVKVDERKSGCEMGQGVKNWLREAEDYR